MRKYLAVTTLVVLILALAVAAAACGGGDIAGTYKIDSDEALLADVRMVLDADGGFELKGPDADTGDTMTITGTYTVDGDAVTLKAKGVDEAEKATVEDGKLVFKDVTWVKQ